MNMPASGPMAATGYVCPLDVYSDLRRVAKRLCRRTRTEHLEDDVVQAGALGLVEAKIRFAPERGVPFGAYALLRVRGAMLDEIRNNMPLSRRLWARGDQPPVCVEMPDELGADTMPLADERLIRARDLRALRCALQRRSEAERSIIIAVYDFDDEGASGAAHARSLGCSRSRVSRNHLQVLNELRQGMEAEAAHG
jgi:RNA polymerase sigma factor (sigma-70 family)